MRRFSKKQQQTLCFFGHRDISDWNHEVESQTSQAIESMIHAGYRYFGAGGGRGFDMLASEAVLRLKAQKHPNIHLILVLPFESYQERDSSWTQAERERFLKVREGASKVVVFSSEYSSGVYYRRNRHLIDSSSACIVYLKQQNTDTSLAVNYAKSRQLKVVNVVRD